MQPFKINETVIFQMFFTLYHLPMIYWSFYTSVIGKHRQKELSVVLLQTDGQTDKIIPMSIQHFANHQHHKNWIF